MSLIDVFEIFTDIEQLKIDFIEFLGLFSIDQAFISSLDHNKTGKIPVCF